MMIVEKDCDNWKELWWLKKIAIIEKNCDNWKELWWLKKIVIIEKDCDDWDLSSNINEVIRAVLSFLFFFLTKRFHTHKKHKKRKT